ncbi:MAG: hypothetical protein ACE5DK_05605 [Paracoccaceae bacterium]
MHMCLSASRLAFALLVLVLAAPLNAGSLPRKMPHRNTIRTILHDMKWPPDAAPHGVPASYDWSDGSAVVHRLDKVKRSILADYHAFTAWGQVYESIEGNPATNTRVQIRNLRAFVLSKSELRWFRAQSYPVVTGAMWREDFVGPPHHDADIRFEDGGGISVTVGNGYVFHFFPPERAPFDHSDVLGIWVSVQARLVVGDKNLPDDREKAKIVMNVGADLWPWMTGELAIAPEVGMGRFRYVTPYWRSYNMISLTPWQVRSFPPPL